MERKPRETRNVRDPEAGARIGVHMVSREDPTSARIEIRTDQETKAALIDRAFEAGADSLSAFLLERGAAEPTRKEKSDWKKRSREAVAKRKVAKARKELRAIQEKS